MKKILISLSLVVSLNAGAQVSKVMLQASGLTCSMCSKAINKSLSAVEFVDKVTANIKNSSFEVSFKPGATVDFDRMKKAVEDAGFFVADFKAVVHFNGENAVNDEHLIVGDKLFHFLNIHNQVLSGDKTIRLLDKGYVSSKEFKKNNLLTKKGCYKTGVAGTCCTADEIKSPTRVYHVTI